METGLKHTSTLVVEERHLAATVGSGDLRVLATPVMMSLMENAAMLAVSDYLEEGSTTVGGHIESSHIHPTTLGKSISATAELVKIDGRKLSFKISASDDHGVIGEGTHLRFIVNAVKFMSKLQEE